MTASAQTEPGSSRSPDSSVQVASMREFCITTSDASLLICTVFSRVFVSTFAPRNSTCDASPSASLPRASSVALLIASCGQ